MAKKKNVFTIKKKQLPVIANEPVAGNKVIDALTDIATQKAVFSNFALIQHSEYEFLVDFVQRFQTGNLITSRVVMTPNQIKALHKALGTNIQSYEDTFGEIKPKSPVKK